MLDEVARFAGAIPKLSDEAVTKIPELVLENGRDFLGVSVVNLAADVISSLVRINESHDLGRFLRVSVADSSHLNDGIRQDLGGRYQISETQLLFIPFFPFERGVPYTATFKGVVIGRRAAETLSLEFTLAKHVCRQPSVEHVYPTENSLPENLLRFYVTFSNPMQRGRFDEAITVLGPDGILARDVLYRAPVELWDPSMRCLTILLDPGRLKRGVGPNRELGPPLLIGREYTLSIGTEMVDLYGQQLIQAFSKRFMVADAVREPVAIDQWAIHPPATGSLDPLILLFPRPLDWAILLNAISIASNEEQINGLVSIDQLERRWAFTPSSPWTSGVYEIRVSQHLEDVCGNDRIAAFDRPLRTADDLANTTANPSLSFNLQ